MKRLAALAARQARLRVAGPLSQPSSEIGSPKGSERSQVAASRLSASGSLISLLGRSAGSISQPSSEIGEPGAGPGVVGGLIRIVPGRSWPQARILFVGGSMDARLQELRRRAPLDAVAELALFAEYERLRVTPPFDELEGSRRWHKVVGVVRKWTVRPLERRDGAAPRSILATERRLGVPLPQALREWYALIGARGSRRNGTTAGRALLKHDPPSLTGGGGIVFARTGTAMWATPVEDVGSPDPRVFAAWPVGASPSEWHPTGPLCPDFFLGLLLYTMLEDWNPDHAGIVRTHRGTRAPDRSYNYGERIQRVLPRIELPFADACWMEHMPEAPAVRFCGDGDTVVCMRGPSNAPQLRAAARTEVAWQRLEQIVHFDYFARRNLINGRWSAGREHRRR